MAKYVKKPNVIEAMHFTDEEKNRVHNWVGSNCYADFDKDGVPVLKINTPEGVMTATLGCYILKGYSTKLGYHFWINEKSYFEENYDEVEE